MRPLWLFLTAAFGPLPSMALVALARVYQLLVSPWIGANCRFTPTCSSYFIQAVEKYGALRGSYRGLRRVARCHPWNPGGHDPP
ncbi:putative membrane protein insertion efficiency factor [Posidoniimonas polymericola]|uniref:Putative membrane protein insertion efficiency factor n=1 Tax=Posidoniimonas polymericola TaxID=2528002 RepID=A0A5C5YTG1_9BACT|nr:membrane protein insertion efficiency factor YidD [Posidoniimonas polymericola]TWT78091.1 putative membrane protein insertion efficiency factor [Posidoniimonas polymericola]